MQERYTTFRALRLRNYRLFFGGQGVSLIGTWMQQIAMSWLVYRMTDSAFLLGAVAFCTQIPSFLLSPLTGVLADRWDRRAILVVTQTISMVQAFVLALLIFTGVIAVWHIIVLGVLIGCVNAFDIPARHSFVIDMVEKKEMLGNAIALNSFMFNAARLIGPSIAGVLIASLGEGVCFFLNGVSFIFVILALLAMQIVPRKMQPRTGNLIEELREGVSYAFGFPPIRAILMLISAISLMGMSYAVLMPVFARDVLGGGPRTLGTLMASAGVGALIGTLYLASQKDVLALRWTLPASTAIFGAGLIAFSFSRLLPLSILLLFIAGFGLIVQMAMSNTILQMIVDDDKRGRVMSLYTMAFMGMTPLGSLLSGYLASRFGAPFALALGGFVCVAAAWLFATRVPALQRMLHGISGAVPDLMGGIETVTELINTEKE
ncbi:MAG: MFS transporter [Candidatus Aureabacteria bacterium]|nr:MFS transporter [Candidatus Auribacterota bacterium]